jgi:hypothetical protein
MEHFMYNERSKEVFLHKKTVRNQNLLVKRDQAISVCWVYFTGAVKKMEKHLTVQNLNALTVSH